MRVLLDGLDNFRNTKDKDIELFLREKALEFEKRHWCSTYLLLDEDAMKTKKEIKVEGYFTLSNKILGLGDSISKSNRKKIFNGFPSEDNFVHTILIGQLGKHIDENADSDILGKTCMEELLDMSFEIIEEVSSKIPCRCVLIECREISECDTESEQLQRAKLHKKYQDYGFKFLQQDGCMVNYVLLI